MPMKAKPFTEDMNITQLLKPDPEDATMVIAASPEEEVAPVGEEPGLPETIMLNEVEEEEAAAETKMLSKELCKQVQKNAKLLDKIMQKKIMLDSMHSFRRFEVCNFL